VVSVTARDIALEGIMSKTRVEHVVGKYALRTIQSDTDDQMYVTVTDAAIYMATAGFLREANRSQCGSSTD
jgi:hypothetical protein